MRRPPWQPRRGRRPSRHEVTRLESLRGQIEGLARRLSLQHQRDVYHCRLHVALVLEEARDRLRRTEGAPLR
jgi:hypothetical protein